ncbi:hypothetical protein [Streptomyces sp. NPDC014894]|uniref:hypothetical protein n=1 Tax=Streptomyces sp. NPDC014894 TaxID=3364931 RepID=UPI0036FAAFC5
MDPSSHFVFGTHPEHGFVATATVHTPIHLADWYLTREQFEQVPGTPGLYRLTTPEADGIRRTRQAVHDLRARGFAVYADYSLDPANDSNQSTTPHRAASPRSRIVRAAAARPPQLGPAPVTSPPRSPERAATAPAVSRPARSR